MEHIDSSRFKSRFVSMVASAQGFPKKNQDRHILLISATFDLEPGRRYSEREINDALRVWTERFGDAVDLDHVTLRRYLVDERYIARDPKGQEYELTATAAPYTWDDDLKTVDLDALVAEARAERERRKQQYLGSARE